jgi:D-2-hydroxyacid dehydrogenase (NADP+)
VFDDEPLPRNHPFYGREDVLVTHHSSYASAASEQEVFERFQRNVARYARGEPLEGEIDVRLGY